MIEKTEVNAGIALAAQQSRESFNNCSEWSKFYRRVKTGLPYSLDRFPYIREPMDSGAERNYIMKGAQTGLSETAISISLFAAIRERLDVAYYFPTKAKMTEFAKSRIYDAIVNSPFINSRVHTNNDSMKKFNGGGTIFLLGANSDRDLKSTSVARLIMDEFDEWTDRAINLALERTAGQIDTPVRIWGFSTPKWPGVGIDAKFSEGVKEFFFFKCPHCREYITPEWDIEGKTGRHCIQNVEKPEVAEYICWRCKGILPHDRKREMYKGGKFFPMRKDGGADFDYQPSLRQRGFYIPQMLSPSVTPEQFAEKWGRGQQGDLDAIREFHNSALGLPYLEHDYRVTDAHLRHAKTVKKYRLTDVEPLTPKKDIVTLGVDQGGVNHWVAVKWTFDRDRLGDPNDRAIGQVIGLGTIKPDTEGWQRLAGIMREFAVLRVVIDYNPDPAAPLKFVKLFRGFGYLCQYSNGISGKEIRPQEDDYGANIVRVDRSAWLSKTVARVAGGDLLLPLDTSEEFEDNVKNLVRTINRDTGRAEFPFMGPDHYGHALAYAEIGLKLLDPSLATSNIITRR